MRRDFIANVSHELKTPLTVVTGFIETLQDLDLEPQQRRRYLQLMQDQARSMQRLVDDLLTLSALESEQNPLADTPFAIVPLLLALSADAKALSAGRHTIALDIGDAATVTGSRDELASAFGNLISNAIRYTPDGGTITLHWRVAADGTGEFSGRGHRHRHRARARAAAHRALLPRRPQPFARDRRHGLGLAIVKHVLLRHQAELDVDSEPGAAARSPRAFPRSVCGPSRNRKARHGPRRRLPVSERRAEQRDEVVARDILRRVADHAVLRLGAGGERVEV